MKAKLKFTWEFPLILLQLAWLAYTRLFQNLVLVDDAYIHFRNALNLVRGRGMLFNPGESVLATTSPVYVCLLGLFNRLTGVDFPRLAAGFNFACEAGVTLCLVVLLRRVKVPLLARHAVILIVNLEFWRMLYAHSGMEESLFILACLLILLAIEGGAWVAAGLLLGVLGWVRPEGAVIWLAGALGLALLRRWRDLVRIYGLATLLALAIAGLLLYIYGTFIPQSVNAKGNAPWFGGGIGGYGPVQFVITLGDLTFFYLFNGFHSRWGSAADRINSLLPALAQLSLMSFGLRWIWSRGGRFIALFLWIFFVGYYLFHAILATCLFPWYFVPYYFISQLLAGLGWWALIQAAWDWLARRWPARPALGPVFYRLALPGLVLLYAFSGAASGRALNVLENGNVSAWEGLKYRLKASTMLNREPHYIAIAKAFNELVPEGDRAQVGCVEIGIFGYYFHGRVLDVFGLVSPEVLDVLKPEVREKLPASCRVFPWDIFMHFKPEYVMSTTAFLADAPAEFLKLYERIQPVQSDQLIAYKLKAGVSRAAPGGAVRAPAR